MFGVSGANVRQPGLGNGTYGTRPTRPMLGSRPTRAMKPTPVMKTPRLAAISRRMMGLGGGGM